MTTTNTLNNALFEVDKPIIYWQTNIDFSKKSKREIAVSRLPLESMLIAAPL